MNLTNIHLNIIHNGIAGLDCYDCFIIDQCQSREITYCKEISEWLKERMEELIK